MNNNPQGFIIVPTRYVVGSSCSCGDGLVVVKFVVVMVVVVVEIVFVFMCVGAWLLW